MNRRSLLRGAVLALALRPFKDLVVPEVVESLSAAQRERLYLGTWSDWTYDGSRIEYTDTGILLVGSSGA